jgi:glycosyltransferase involved in cell wall biosynthesis
VTPSKWLGDMAKKSPFFSGRKIEVIPNCLDLDLFKPHDKMAARLKLGLPLNKTLILFGAVEATSVSYKGYDLLIEALFKLPYHSNKPFHFVVFGSKGDSRSLPYGVTFLGALNCEADISSVYQACDVFVTPSKQDNFPSTVLESLACGVPVVGFDVGGIPEMVDHKKCGYIAKCFDADDFAKGVAWIFSSGEYKNLSQNARTKALENYSPQAISKRYIDLYKSINLRGN